MINQILNKFSIFTKNQKNILKRHVSISLILFIFISYSKGNYPETPEVGTPKDIIEHYMIIGVPKY